MSGFYAIIIPLVCRIIGYRQSFNVGAQGRCDLPKLESDTDTEVEHSLRFLLFRKRSTPDSEPLFKGPRDLAEQIAAASNGHIKAPSVYTKLSPILSGKKTAAVDFEQLMLAAVEKRLRRPMKGLTTETRQEILSEIKQALRDTEARLVQEGRREVGLSERLVEVSSRSQLRLLISPGYTNPHTGTVALSEIENEEVRASTAAIFLHALHLIGSKRGQPSDARFVNLYKSKQEVWLFWEILFKVLIGETKINPPVASPYTREEAADILERLDRQARVQFYVVSPCYCLVPLVMYDPHRQERGEVFLLYFKLGRLAPYEVPREHTAIWRVLFEDFLSQTYQFLYSPGGDDTAHLDTTDDPQAYVKGWRDGFGEIVSEIAGTGEGKERQKRGSTFKMEPPQRILFESRRAAFIVYAEMYGWGAAEGDE